jgi:hypothetical protein
MSADVYALALSRRTRLRLFDSVCGWFDEYDYLESNPLQRRQKTSAMNVVAGPK